MTNYLQRKKISWFIEVKAAQPTQHHLNSFVTIILVFPKLKSNLTNYANLNDMTTNLVLPSNQFNVKLWITTRKHSSRMGTA